MLHKVLTNSRETGIITVLYNAVMEGGPGRQEGALIHAQ